MASLWLRAPDGAILPRHSGGNITQKGRSRLPEGAAHHRARLQGESRLAAIGLAPVAEVAAAIKAADRAVSRVTYMEAGELVADLEKAQGS
jgi:hypothetical protein